MDNLDNIIDWDKIENDLNQVCKKKNERYEDNRPQNREVITNISLKQLKEQILKMTEAFMDEYTIATDEDLQKFNQNIIDETEMERLNKELKEKEQEYEQRKNTVKKCSGRWHKTDEDRMKPLTDFYQNKGKNGGHSAICKNCYALMQNRQGYNDKRRTDKPIPVHDNTQMVSEMFYIKNTR